MRKMDEKHNETTIAMYGSNLLENDTASENKNKNNSTHNMEPILVALSGLLPIAIAAERNE
jgi:hypothetical protein